jgi:dTMP kinase
VLEGTDGVGKTTQAELLHEALQVRGISSQIFREPGGDPLGEEIRAMLLHGKSQMEDKTEMLLFNAARVQAVKLISGVLERGVWVIGDRNYISTMAYQCYARGLDAEQVRPICLYATKEASPELIVILSAPIELTKARQGEAPDRIESESREFFERVHAGYLAEAQVGGFPVIDAARTISEVHQEVWKHVEPLLERL